MDIVIEVGQGRFEATGTWRLEGIAIRVLGHEFSLGVDGSEEEVEYIGRRFGKRLVVR